MDQGNVKEIQATNYMYMFQLSCDLHFIKSDLSPVIENQASFPCNSEPIWEPTCSWYI